MMKIKVNKEFTLLGLIEYIKKNGIANKVFLNKKGKEKVVVGDDRHLYMTDLNLTDTFTVEVEEVITEETVIPRLLEVYKFPNGTFNAVLRHKSCIRRRIADNERWRIENLAFYMLNDDASMTLIWKDGEMVE